MKKLFLGALILITLLITGCNSDKEKNTNPDPNDKNSIFYRNPELSGEGKPVDLNLEGY